VVDTSAGHHRRVVKAEIPALQTADLSLFFLPPSRPEVPRIEPLGRQITSQDMPAPSLLPIEALHSAGDAALPSRSGSFQSPIQLPQRPYTDHL
jgi:hypothetical protein